MNDKELLFELKQSLKEEIQAEMTVMDTDVLKQRSRLFKLFCLVWYGHLYRDGVCLRCQKVEQSKK